MLEKGFENYDITFENILKRMKLIAARELKSIEFNEYLNSIRQELSGKVENPEEMKIIGKKLRCPMEEDEIEAGIKLGLALKEKDKEQSR